MCYAKIRSGLPSQGLRHLTPGFRRVLEIKVGQKPSVVVGFEPMVEVHLI